MPGLGVRATIGSRQVEVGNVSGGAQAAAVPKRVGELSAEGAAVVAVSRDGVAVGYIAVADRIRDEVTAALARVRELGVPTVELLTGDAEQTAARLVGELDIGYRAQLLPEDKIRVVK